MFAPETVAGLYYINLDERIDRNEHMLRLLKYCPWPCTRVPGVRLRVDPADIGVRLAERHRDQPHVASIFLSHQRALLTALSASINGLSIVVEDDLQINPELFRQAIVDLTPLPREWDVILVSVRYRSRPKVTNEPTAWLTNPFGAGLVNASLVKQDVIVTGAHFCIFQDRAAIARVLAKMRSAEVIEDLDIWYMKNVACYFLHSDHVGVRPALGSNHHDRLSDV